MKMKNILLISIGFLFTTGILAQDAKLDWANFGRYEQSNTQAPEGGVVFMGNSITEGWVNTHPDFFKKNNFIGRGISGQVSSQMLVRFRRDVIDLNPRAVVILAGTNDIAQNNGFITLKNILANIISMCELAKANHIGVILCSVLPADHFGWRKELKPADAIIALNVMIRNYALQNKIPYVDYHLALKDEQNGLPEKYAKDGVHPTAEAYTIMESLVKSAIDAMLNTSKKSKSERKYLFSKN